MILSLKDISLLIPDIVRNKDNELLFIFRKGKWDLPKGKVDNNEKNKE